MTKTTTIPAWTYEGKTPSKYTFFEAIALAGLEGQSIRLDAETQRCLLGFAVFGRRAITIYPTGVVRCVVSLCFGADFAVSEWDAETLQVAAATQKQLHPNVSGRKYFNVFAFEKQRIAV